MLHQDHPGDKPTLTECIRFQGREGTINIPQEISTKYYNFGIILLEDKNGAIVHSLEHKHMRDANKINREIIEKWVAGKGRRPLTWMTLAQVLRDIELSTLAEEIEAIKSQPNT